MIQRIILLKLNKEFATDSERAAVADYSGKVLKALPGVLRAEIGSPADETSAGSWDISMVLNFASTCDLEPFRTHPEHRAYVDGYLKPKLTLIKAWNLRVA